MAAHDQITVADLKAFAPLVGNGRDAVLQRYVSTASKMIEDDLGRRLRFRAPAEAVSDLVASILPADGALTIANQPNAAGRTVFVELTDDDSSVRAGQVTLTGTVEGVAGVTESITLAPGKQHGLKFFTALSNAVVSGVAGAVGADRIRIGTTVGYVEYHTPDCADPCLLPLEWPVAQLLEVNEDAARVHGTSTRLVSGTDYLLTRKSGGDGLVRMSSLLPRAWMSGWRSTKLTLSAGYSMATMPDQVRDVCRRLALLLYDEIENKRLGMSGRSDAQGNWTRFAPSMLTPEMHLALGSLRRYRYGSDTGERDFDLEAA